MFTLTNRKDLCKEWTAIHQFTKFPLILCKIQQWSQILRTLAHKGECEDWGFIQFSCGASFMLKFLQRVVQYTNRQTLAGH